MRPQADCRRPGDPYLVGLRLSPSDTLPGVNPRQVTVIASGQVQGVPDTLTANVAIESAAADVTTAMNQTNERQQG